MPNTKPNILVLMTDQQRYDTVSAYGVNPICRTPHIDNIARRGIRFDRAFTPTAICSPARASFFTGLYPHKHGVTANALTLREGVRGISDYLADAGYVSGYAGKWHVDEKRGPSEFGFIGRDFLGYAFPGSGLLPGLQFDLVPQGDENHYETFLKERGLPIPTVSHRFVGANPSNQEQEMFALHEGPVESSIEYFVAEETMRVLRELDGRRRPFFLWANFWGPHTPCLLPEPYFSMYNPRDIPEHPSYRETFERKPRVQQNIEKLWGLGGYGWRGFQEIAARYYGHCTLIDDMVGRVLAELDRLGLADNTVVFFTADHGDCMGAHKLIEKGEFMYDEIYRIPLVVAHPKCQKPGGTNDDFVYLHEFLPTAMEMAGLDAKTASGDGAGLDGRSFLPAVLGRNEPNGREEVYCVFKKHFTTPNQRMVRTRTHQFTFNSGDIGELYDLVADPYQLNNVYGQPEYESVRLDLINRMDRYMRELNDPLYQWFRRVKAVY